MDNDCQYSKGGESLNDWSAREAARAPVSIYNRKGSVVGDAAPTLSGLGESDQWLEKKPDSRKKAGRTPSFRNHKWPLLRSKGSRPNMISAIGEFKESQDPSQAAITSRPNLRPMASHPNLTTRKPELLSSKKRKASVPDVNIGPMTTVQEGLLDSPTIPYHHPFLARSLTFPETVLGRLSEDSSEKTPRIPDFPKPNVGMSLCSSQAGQRADKLGRTITSAKSQNDLRPLAIPTKVKSSNATSTQTLFVQDNDDQKPPKVPPKSPRTESRASPRIKQLPHSASSSTSTIHSTSSSATSANSPFAKALPKPQQYSNNVEITNDQLGVLDNAEGKSSSNHLKHIERLGRQTPPRVESPSGLQSGSYKSDAKTAVGPWARLDQIGRKSPPRVGGSPVQHDELNEIGGIFHPRSPKSTGESGSPCAPYRQEQPVAKLNLAKRSNSEKCLWHQRDVSGASLIDRGRPMKRGDTCLMGTLSRPNLVNLKLTDDSIELPSGFIAKEASKVMHSADLELLKQEAELKVDRFEVLSAKDVSNLSKELALLDERCEYLRRTHSSLRQGRQGLHTRMILYLKSPQTSKFSRDSILKQEEALAELDCSIDDWVLKLEQADHRRNQISQKLLEHFAAALTLKTAPNGQPQHVTNMPTPPMSPEKPEDLYCKQRRDVQSIKVYADWGVAALLSAIEQEIGLLDNSNTVS